MKLNVLFGAVITFVGTLSLLGIVDKSSDAYPHQYQQNQNRHFNFQPYYPPPNFPPTKPQPRKPEISVKVPEYLNYEQTISQLKKWNQEAPDFTEVGTYGKSSRGKDLYYLKIENPATNIDGEKPIVLITACIHGNEPLSASTVMGYIGTMLGTYGQDTEATNLIDNRILYFIPVVSPDSYPHSRHVDGVDPNRNFPTRNNPNRKSVPPIEALKSFFLKIKPHAIISGHTYGRIYLIPWGDRTQLCEHNEDYQRIVGEMCQLSKYRMQRACEMYNRPIYGGEVDWYYTQGSFSIVMEFGTHQRVPTKSEIQHEFDRTYKAVLYFIKHAPLVRKRNYYHIYRFPAHVSL